MIYTYFVGGPEDGLMTPDFYGPAGLHEPDDVVQATLIAVGAEVVRHHAGGSYVLESVVAGVVTYRYTEGHRRHPTRRMESAS